MMLRAMQMTAALCAIALLAILAASAPPAAQTYPEGAVRPAGRLKLLGHKRVTAAERKRRQRNLLPHLKIFLQKRLSQKATPFRQNRLGQVCRADDP